MINYRTYNVVSPSNWYLYNDLSYDTASNRTKREVSQQEQHT